MWITQAPRAWWGEIDPQYPQNFDPSFLSPEQRYIYEKGKTKTKISCQEDLQTLRLQEWLKKLPDTYIQVLKWKSWETIFIETDNWEWLKWSWFIDYLTRNGLPLDGISDSEIGDEIGGTLYELSDNNCIDRNDIPFPVN